MASSSFCLSAASLAHCPSPSRPPQQALGAAVGSLGCLLLPPSPLLRRSRRRGSGVVCVAPDEEKMTRRSPLDFPVDWERPRRGRRPDIFPQFSPMKTPLPIPLPEDPPLEDDEEEEEEQKEEEEEDPEKENEEPKNP